ncbi:hypothetical protein [Paenibacillus sp. CMAA1364]
MLSVAGIVFVIAIIIAIDVPPLIRKKLIRELWVFSILLLFGTILAISQALRFNIPNPLDWLTFVYKPVSDLVQVWLK